MDKTEIDPDMYKTEIDPEPRFLLFWITINKNDYHKPTKLGLLMNKKIRWQSVLYEVFFLYIKAFLF